MANEATNTFMAKVMTENARLKENRIVNDQGVTFTIPTDDTKQLVILRNHKNTCSMAASLPIKPMFWFALIMI